MSRKPRAILPIIRNSLNSWLAYCERWLERVSRRKVLFVLMFLLAALILTVARRIETVTVPQFYAEDGVFWYAEAYHAQNDLDPFLVPKQGYYQTISRIGAWLSLSVDLQYAPLVFNVLAILATVLPALYFLMRFEPLVPRVSHRLFLALASLLIPGSEVHANLTNAHWHLAILMILIILAPPARSLGGKVADAGALVIAGLSGPFVFFAFPLFALYLWRRRTPAKYWLFALLGVLFLIQANALFFIETDAPRSPAPLGATFTNFSMILGGNVFLKSLLGSDLAESIRDHALWNGGALPAATLFAGMAFLVRFLWRAPFEARLFVGFLFFVFAGCLASPVAHLSEPQWTVMSGGGTGRYYYLPGFGWITALAFLCVLERNTLWRTLAGILLLIFIGVAVPQSFEVKKYRNYHFPEQVARFRVVEPGTPYAFKVIPGWTMTLVKKSQP